MFKVIGNGSFGTAIKHIITNSGFELSEQARFIIPAVPSYAVPDVLGNISNQTIIFVSKGFLPNGQLLGEWADERKIDWAVLAGPHFASEIIKNLPTFSIMGYQKEIEEFKKWKNMNISFSTNKLGVQILGALKNIFACFFGIIHGLNLGKNFSASMIVGVIQEIKQIFKDLNLDTEIINSPAGIGDLILTCNSIESRNFKEGSDRVSGIKTTHLSEACHSAIAFEIRSNGQYKICRFISEIMKNDLRSYKEINHLFLQYNFMN